MSNVENKVIKNWKNPEVFKTLKAKDLIGKKEVVFKVFGLTRGLTTIKETGEDRLEIKEYICKDGKVVNNKTYERVNPETAPIHFYYPEKKIDQEEYNQLKSILRGALSK